MVVPFTTPASTLHSLLRLTYPRQVEIVGVNTADGYITPRFQTHSLKYFKLNQEIPDLLIQQTRIYRYINFRRADYKPITNGC